MRGEMLGRGMSRSRSSGNNFRLRLRARPEATWRSVYRFALAASCERETVNRLGNLRRHMMHRRWLFLAIAFLALARPPHAAAGESTKRPNVIIILADDLGYGDLGCYGHPRFKTPNLDRMAAEGVRLTQFNTPMPFCAPTRAALLDGPLSVSLRHDGQSRPGRRAQGRRDRPAARARSPWRSSSREAGYATGMVGKWHLGHAQTEFSADAARLRRVPRHPLQQRHAARAADRGREGRRVPGRAGDADASATPSGRCDFIERQPEPAVLPLLRPRHAAQAAGVRPRRSTRRAARACTAT